MVSSMEGVTAYINAGGRGTRISAALPNRYNDPVVGVSKALLEVGPNRTPLIDHHIQRLIRIGMPSIVAGVGNHAHVKRYIDSIYSDRPNVHAFESDEQRGTGGDLIRALASSTVSFSPSILINNVDTILDIDEHELVGLHRDMGAGMTIGLTLRKGVPNEGAFIVGDEDTVIFSNEASKNTTSREAALTSCIWAGSSTGTLVVEAELVHEFAKTIEPQEEVSLYKDIVGYALGQNALKAYNNGERYFLDVGTVDTWQQAQSDAKVIASLLAN